MKPLRVALAQINTTVGDIAGNVEKILASARQAAQADVDVVAFPELTLTGYPPEDLLLRPEFIRDNLGALDEVVAGCGSLTAVVGLVDRDGAGLYNAAAIIQNGTLGGIYRKQRLPNYGVFDEKRYFQTGTANPVYTIAGLNVAVNVCEDIWFPGDPTESQAAAGAQVVININGSPYHAGKRHFREEMLSGRARDYGVW
ncbi:MAG TPA: nitrilase-related carbon-nitrogen hydrolase, partial [Dehalococcoidia bacterium]|nr:nitrilase-related carbon-nitrogen hydrolase [Dehalococcoidia bacterium]